MEASHFSSTTGDKHTITCRKDMDQELLIALIMLWCSTTTALVSFLRMWFSYAGESFHPHSVDVEHRHGLFLVVNSKTVCKLDCTVKSISAFVAPRGSSSSKQFTVLSVMIAVAGMLGSSRWYNVGDASLLEASLSFAGFACLILVAGFEVDVVPERFLEDKLLVTGWLIEKLKLDLHLPFSLNPNDEDFRCFIRESKEIYYLYEEDLYLRNRSKSHQEWKYHSIWPTIHMMGAIGYVVLLPAAIILNDMAELKVGWITGILFVSFSFMGYLTGSYVPVFKYFRGWILLWNPFLREPNFMLKLKKAVEEYCKPTQGVLLSPNPKNKQSPQLRKSISKKNSNGHIPISEQEEAELADRALDSYFLKFARCHPKTYVKIVGHMLVMSELVALLTPSVAIGLQWVTALCDGPPILSIIDLFVLFIECIRMGSCSNKHLTHCILKS